MDPPVILHSDTCLCQFCSVPPFGSSPDLAEKHVPSRVEAIAGETIRNDFDLRYVLVVATVCFVFGLVLAAFF